jgi:hypothetical protein
MGTVLQQRVKNACPPLASSKKLNPELLAVYEAVKNHHMLEAHRFIMLHYLHRTPYTRIEINAYHSSSIITSF